MSKPALSPARAALAAAVQANAAATARMNALSERFNVVQSQRWAASAAYDAACDDLADLSRPIQGIAVIDEAIRANTALLENTALAQAAPERAAAQAKVATTRAAFEAAKKVAGNLETEMRALEQGASDRQGKVRAAVAAVLRQEPQAVQALLDRADAAARALVDALAAVKALNSAMVLEVDLRGGDPTWPTARGITMLKNNPPEIWEFDGLNAFSLASSTRQNWLRLLEDLQNDPATPIAPEG